MIDAHGPAFPIAYRHEHANFEVTCQEDPGINVRTYIATKALAAIVGNQPLNLHDSNQEQDRRMARRAASIADALIAELSKS